MEFRRQILLCGLLAVLIAFFPEGGAGAGHGHDHGQDHDDHAEEETHAACPGATPDPFHEIQEALNITTEQLDMGAITELVNHVLERFDCDELDCTCVKPDDVLSTGGLSAPLDESHIWKLSVILLHKLQSINTTCNGLIAAEWHDWWFHDVISSDDSHELEEFLEKLKNQQENHEEEHEEEGEGHGHEGEEGEGHGHESEGHEEGEGHGHEGQEEGEGHGHESEGHEEEGEGHGHDDHNEGTKCFDAKSVMMQAGIKHGKNPTHGQQEMVASLIVTYLLQGYQIGGCPPRSQDFLDGIWESMNLHEGENLSENEFKSFLSKLNIGSSTAEESGGHEEEGDDHSTHEHRKKRDVTSYRQKRASHGDHGDHGEEETSSVNKCFTGDELLGFHGIEAATGVSQADLVAMCPALLQQRVSGVCSAAKHVDHKGTVDDEAKRIGIGFVCILLISVGSLIGMFMIPCLSKNTELLLLCLFIGLAVGTLAGDALLHLIPVAFGLHAHAHDHAHDDGGGVSVEPYFWKALVIIAGIYLFFVLEAVLSLIGGSHHNQIHHQHEHHEMDTGSKYKNGNDEGSDTSSGMCATVKPVAWMIIIGDAVHNFADGLAVGAAFSLSISSGISTSIAIFCHEVPHEFGDFAVLLNSGMTWCKAAFFNLVSALTAVVGFAIAMAVSTDEESRQWMFTIAAGMFIYIALSDMMPELISLRSGLMEKKKKWLCCFLLQNLGILIGVGLMVIISLYEEKIHNITV